MIKLNAKELRGLRTKAKGLRLKKRLKKKNDIYIVLDNVLDTYNIGSIFRLADAVAAKKVYLCGGTATPPNHRIKKASINTTEVVEWEYVASASEAIEIARRDVAEGLRHTDYGDKALDCRPNAERLQVVAVEQSKKSIPYHQFNYKLPICLIVGNETTGVSKEVLKAVDAIVELPMFGVNISLNVMVSLGIVLYKVIEECLP